MYGRLPSRSTACMWSVVGYTHSCRYGTVRERTLKVTAVNRSRRAVRDLVAVGHLTTSRWPPLRDFAPGRHDPLYFEVCRLSLTILARIKEPGPLKWTRSLIWHLGPRGRRTSHYKYVAPLRDFASGRHGPLYFEVCRFPLTIVARIEEPGPLKWTQPLIWHLGSTI